MKMRRIVFLGPVLATLSLVLGSCDGGGGGGSGPVGGGNGGGTWEQFGSQVSPAGAESQDPSMLVLGSTPAVGYRHQSFRTYLTVWNVTDWGAAKPDPTNNRTNSSIYGTPDFCASGTDVYLAYSHAGDPGSPGAAFYDRIFVYRWNAGSGWAAQNSGNEVSIPWDGFNPGADAWEPAIACTSGAPLVSWVENDIYGIDSDDDAWTAAVSPSGVTRSAANSRAATNVWTADVRTAGITVDGPGNVYVAQWEQSGTNMNKTDLYVTRYNSTLAAATPLGASISGDFDANNLCVPSLAVVGTDLYVAYSEANATDYTKHVYVRKYSGGTWSTVGGGPVSALGPAEHYDSANPDLLAVDGTLYLAWEETDQYGGTFVYVAFMDAGSWTIDGNRLNIDLANTAHDPSLAYSPPDGYLYVAFEEYTDGWPHIFVKRKDLTP